MTQNEPVTLGLIHLDHCNGFGLWQVADEPLPRYVLDVDEDASLTASKFLSGVAEMLANNGVDPHAPIAVRSYLVRQDGHEVLPFQWRPDAEH